MKMKIAVAATILIIAASVMPSFAAYHHEGERDAEKFLSAYPGKRGTKLDHCALCHSGGSYKNNKGKTVSLGSCQWCHYTYGYDGAGNIANTMNGFGQAYKAAGRNAGAVIAIDDDDSDGDGYSNKDEIAAERYPGSADDDPSKAVAPARIYTKAQLEAMTKHVEFLLMNTSRSGDFYAEYTGVPMKDLLDDAGILPTASNVKVIAPDGWSQFHPLDYDPDIEMYHVYGNASGESYQYPPATYCYDLEADIIKNPDYGWCDYSAPSCTGRSHNDSIFVDGGLKAILAYKRDGSHLDTGVLTAENKLDGEGPFRVVVPQKYVEAPDQSSTSTKQDVLWPYNEDWDHNAGSCTRTVTAIKVEPLPEGTTDIDLLETGWNYVDQSKIIVYGAIDGADSNGNGILDSEERNGEADFDGDAVPDYQDPDTAYPRHAEGTDHLLLHASKGAFAGMAAVSCSDPMIPQEGKPAGRNFPYGAVRYSIVGLNPREEVTVTYVFPYNVPVSAKIYIVHDRTGWVELPFESNDGDNIITVTLKDGDSQTDGDGIENGVIVDPITLSTSTGTETASSGGGGSCFVSTLTNHPGLRLGTEIVLSMVVLLIIGIVRRNAVK